MIKSNHGGALVLVIVLLAAAVGGYYLLLGRPQLGQFLQQAPPALDIAAQMQQYRDQMRRYIAQVHVQGVLNDVAGPAVALEDGRVAAISFGYPKVSATAPWVSLGELVGIVADARFNTELSAFGQCPQAYYVPVGYSAERCHIRYVEACKEGDLPTLVLSQYCD